jgi:release factor glutamine methyltransferase
MRIPSNQISSIQQFFRKELKDLFEQEEIEQFIFYSFEYYLGYTRTDLSLNTNNRVSESELLKLNDTVKRLKKKEPIQYILGETWFHGLKFKVNADVLIPRPETEELVEWLLNQSGHIHTSQNNEFKILDIGTGTGCIAIALKKNLTTAAVYALDISEKALEVARANAVLNNADIQFIHADILHPEFRTENHFDLIISNPPYILPSEKANMNANVLEYEPELALFVTETDPLLFYRKIADFAQNRLTERGQLFFEINENKGEEIKNLLGSLGFRQVEIKKDLNGKDRMVKAENQRD